MKDQWTAAGNRTPRDHYAEMWKDSVRKLDQTGMLGALRLGRPYGLTPDEPVEDRHNRPALHHILQTDVPAGRHSEQADIVSLLLTLDADLMKKDGDGLTAADHACVSGNPLAAALVICQSLHYEHARECRGNPDLLSGLRGNDRGTPHPLQNISRHIPPDGKEQAVRNFLKVWERVEEGLDLTTATLPQDARESFMEWVRREHPVWVEPPAIGTFAPLQTAPGLAAA